MSSEDYEDYAAHRAELRAMGYEVVSFKEWMGEALAHRYDGLDIWDLQDRQED